MRALIAIGVWLALSVPLALLVARILRAAGAAEVADQAERWLRRASFSRSEQLRSAALRTLLAFTLLAPLLVAGAVAAWRLPAAVTVTRADGQLALAWPPGQEDAPTTTTSVVEAADPAGVADTATVPAYIADEHDMGGPESTVGRAAAAEVAPAPTDPTPSEGDDAPAPMATEPAPTDPAPDPEPEASRHCPTLERADTDAQKAPPRCSTADDDDEEEPAPSSTTTPAPPPSTTTTTTTTTQP